MPILSVGTGRALLGKAAGISTTVDLPMLADTFLDSSTPAGNYNTATTMQIGEWNGGVAIERGIIQIDFSLVPSGKTFLEAILKMTPTGDFSSNSRTMSAHRCLRDIVFSEATHTRWKVGNNWATAGCSNSSTDYDGAVALGTETQPASPTLDSALSFTMTLDPAELQKLYDGTYTNNGIVLFVDTQVNDMIYYASTDHATPSYWPVVTLTYV